MSEDIKFILLSAYKEFKHSIDIVSLSTVLATLVGVLPNIAALASFIWTMIRIYETNTIQRIMYNRRYDDTNNKK